jgi:hypothetical protein
MFWLIDLLTSVGRSRLRSVAVDCFSFRNQSGRETRINPSIHFTTQDFHAVRFCPSPKGPFPTTKKQMGSGLSKPVATTAGSAAATAASVTTTGGGKGNPLCEDCNKRVATDDTVVPALKECEELYNAVDICMKQHLGRVAPCADQWDAFRECHLRQKERDQKAARQAAPAASSSRHD